MPLNETDSAVRAGRDSQDVARRVIEVQGLPCAIDGSGNVKVLQPVLDRLDRGKEYARFRQGNTVFDCPRSMARYVNSYKGAGTAIFADVAKSRFTAVIDGYTPGPDNLVGAGHERFRATYHCPLSSDWLAWDALCSEEKITQERLADFLDEHAEDIAPPDKDCDKPSSAQLLEMVRNLRIHTKGTFAKAYDPHSGQYELICKQEHTSDSTKIPRAFDLQISPFEEQDLFRVEIRLSFTANPKVLFSLRMHRKRELVRLAFGEIAEALHENCEVPVYMGSRG